MKKTEFIIKTTKKDEMNMNGVCMLITYRRPKDRCWEFVRNKVNEYALEHSIHTLVDLRKASEKLIPLTISSKCCESKIEVRKKKDFPLNSKKCKCGKVYLIKWVYEPK